MAWGEWEGHTDYFSSVIKFGVFCGWSVLLKIIPYEKVSTINKYNDVQNFSINLITVKMLLDKNIILAYSTMDILAKLDVQTSKPYYTLKSSQGEATMLTCEFYIIM